MPDKNPDKTSCKAALPEFLVGIHLPFVQPHPIMPQIKTFCQPQHFALSSPQFPPLFLVDEDGKEKPRVDFLGVSPNLLPPNSQLAVSGAAGMKSQACPSLPQSLTKRMWKIIRRWDIIPVSLKGDLDTQRVTELCGEFLPSLQFDTVRNKSRLS